MERSSKEGDVSGKRGMRIRYKIAIVMSLLIFVTAMVFSVVDYAEHKSVMMEGVDAKLLTAAHFTKGLLPDDYHDNIVDGDSVSVDDYLEIVDEYNGITKELDLEYVWSLMELDGVVYFTSGTSTSKDVSQGDHALFFDVHSNPEAYEKVFETEEIQYQTIMDKWGTIRAVLVPYTDVHGRKYLIGASMTVTDLEAHMGQSVMFHVYMGLIVLLLGIIASFFFAHTISKPITRITELAQKISEGDYSQKSKIDGTHELNSLSRSMNKMSDSIKISRKKLGQKVVDLERFTKVAMGREEKMIELKKRIAEHEREKSSK